MTAALIVVALLAVIGWGAAFTLLLGQVLHTADEHGWDDDE